MENYIDLAGYSVILPVYGIPELNDLEKVILKLLKTPYTGSEISKLLQFDISPFLYGFEEKGILRPDGSFIYRNPDQWALLSKKEFTKGFVFKNKGENLLYDCVIPYWEIRIEENNMLANFLGEEYTGIHLLETIHILEEFQLQYDVHTIKYTKPLRKLSQTHTCSNHIVYEERPNG